MGNGIDTTPEIEFMEGVAVNVHVYMGSYRRELISTVYALTEGGYTEHRFGFEVAGIRTISRENLDRLGSMNPNSEENIPISMILGSSREVVEKLLEDKCGYYQIDI